MKGRGRRGDRKHMSLDVIQLVLGIVTFFTFVMAARTGVSVDEPRDTASAHTGDTEFIRR